MTSVPRLRIASLNYDALTKLERNHARGYPCVYCWDVMHAPTWDHVIPLSKGGPNNRGNLVVVCKYCNADKADLMLPEYQGTLLAMGSVIGKRVAKFSEWVIQDWSADEKDQYARVVARAWSDAFKAKMSWSDAHHDMRRVLGQMMKTQLIRTQTQGKFA